jgi:hypothetical protein
MTDDAPRSLPDIDFATFVLSLASSVLVNLGEMENPETGAKERNLPLAKQTVDILAMLARKTAGNLSEEEQKLIEGLLYDLRIKYVDAHKRAATEHAEARQKS